MFLFPSVDEVECDVVMLNSDQITSFTKCPKSLERSRISSYLMKQSILGLLMDVFSQ